MTREAEVVALLRADEPLALLAPGGVYADSDLGVEGISDAVTMPDVWTGGSFQPTLIVRQGQRVPTGLFNDYKTQTTDTNQRISLWAYATTRAEIEAILEAGYRLLMGHSFARAWPTQHIGGGAPYMQAPELAAGINQMSEEYLIRSLRRPVLEEA